VVRTKNANGMKQLPMHSNIQTLRGVLILVG